MNQWELDEPTPGNFLSGEHTDSHAGVEIDYVHDGVVPSPHEQVRHNTVEDEHASTFFVADTPKITLPQNATTNSFQVQIPTDLTTIRATGIQPIQILPKRSTRRKAVLTGAPSAFAFAVDPNALSSWFYDMVDGINQGILSSNQLFARPGVNLGFPGFGGTEWHSTSELYWLPAIGQDGVNTGTFLLGYTIGVMDFFD